MKEFKQISLPQLNIGIFTDSYAPYISGVVRSIQIFRRDLEILGHNVFIFAPDYPKARPEKNIFRYLSLPAPTQPDFFFPIPISYRLSSTVNNLKLNIIHAHTPFLMGSLGASMARRYNLPLLFTYHTLYQHYTHYLPIGKSISTHIINNWNKSFCNRCDAVIAPSSFVKELIQGSGVKKPVHIIPTGIDLDDYSSNEKTWIRSKYGLGPHEKIILHVGRLAQEKNITFLIEVAEELLKSVKGFKFVIVGTGPVEADLKLLCRKKKIDQYVIFTGRVSYAELLKCYAGGDIFVFSSRSETQGIVLIEAKASGMPIVSLESSCTAEMLQDGEDGFLVQSKELFVQKVRFLLDNETKAQEMGDKARSNAAAFSAPSLTRKLEKIYYQTLLQKKNLFTVENIGNAVK